MIERKHDEEEHVEKRKQIWDEQVNRLQKAATSAASVNETDLENRTTK